MPPKSSSTIAYEQLAAVRQQLTYMRFRASAYIFICFVALLGCSSKRQLEKAQNLVDQGRPEEAVRAVDRLLSRLDKPQEQSRAYLVLGDALLKLGQTSEAFNAYQNALAADAGNQEAQYRAADMLLKSGNPTQALMIADVLVVSRPKDEKVLSLRGAALAAAGNVAEAKATFERALQIEPQSSESAIALAELLLMQNNVGEARALLTSSANRRNAVAWLALGRLEEQEGNPAAAEAAYRAAVTLRDDQETNFRLAQFLQRSSKISEALVVLRHLDALNARATASADFSFTSGRSIPALVDYVRSLNRRSESSNYGHQDSDLVARTVEAALSSQRPLADRIRAAKALLESNRGKLDPATLATLEAEIALITGDLNAADEATTRALESAPQSSAAHYLRGVLFDHRGDEEGARSEWQMAAAIDGHRPSKILLAQLALQQRDATRAEEEIASVVRDEPANVEALLIYARVLEAQNRLEAAQAMVERALAVDPSCAAAMVITGRIALARGAAGSALIAFEKALLFDDRAISSVDGLLEVFAKGKPTRASIAKVERMAGAPPESPVLFEVAGRLYALTGFKRDAERALRRSLALDSRRPTTALALSRIGSELSKTSNGTRSEALIAASSAEQSGAIDAAVRDYEQAIQRGESSGVAANNLAFAYASRGQKLDRALELAVSAVHLMPNKSETMDTLGFVLFKMRRFSAATDAFERALLLPGDPAAKEQITLHLAEAYEASGLPEKAREVRLKQVKPAS
jgi:tetratricopeptide (TPR) repeat protein